MVEGDLEERANWSVKESRKVRINERQKGQKQG
jgi:hypothetical protein